MSYYQSAKTHAGIGKRNAEIFHSIKRARQRYGLELSVADIESIAKIIRTRASERVKALSNTRVVHRLTYKKKVVLVVYDKKRHTLVTFLPKESMVND
jgi:hypothetical protein